MPAACVSLAGPAGLSSSLGVSSSLSEPPDAAEVQPAAAEAAAAKRFASGAGTSSIGRSNTRPPGPDVTACSVEAALASHITRQCCCTVKADRPVPSSVAFSVQTIDPARSTSAVNASSSGASHGREAALGPRKQSSNGIGRASDCVAPAASLRCNHKQSLRSVPGKLEWECLHLPFGLQSSAPMRQPTYRRCRCISHASTS